MNKKVAVLGLSLTLLISFVVIIVEMPIPVSAGTIYVDDDNSGPEDVVIEKTITYDRGELG